MTHETEAPVVSDDVSVPEPLEIDMHPIAEHPAAEAEAATETAAEVRGQKHCIPNKPTHCAATCVKYQFYCRAACHVAADYVGAFCYVHIRLLEPHHWL